MIRRDAGDDWLLITQVDHAALAGEIGRHFGNDLFARPQPRDDAVAAFSLHDAGWPLHDDNPTLNPHGQPLHVFESTLDIGLPIWTASADRAAQAAGPYAGLLVSLHSLLLSTLFSRHLGSPDLPFGERNRQQFLLNKFQHREIERQENLRKQLGLRTDVPLQYGLADPGTNAAEDNLRYNFRLLQAADRISLTLCCNGLLFPQIEEIHPRPGLPPINLQLRRASEDLVTISPWPCDTNELRFRVPARRLAKHAFSNEAEFQSAYAAAPREEVVIALRESPD